MSLDLFLRLNYLNILMLYAGHGTKRAVGIGVAGLGGTRLGVWDVNTKVCPLDF